MASKINIVRDFNMMGEIYFIIRSPSVSVSRIVENDNVSVRQKSRETKLLSIGGCAGIRLVLFSLGLSTSPKEKKSKDKQ